LEVVCLRYDSVLYANGKPGTSGMWFNGGELEGQEQSRLGFGISIRLDS